MGTKIDFQHQQSAHCENGVISSLLKYQGIELSEPMIFGIGSGIFFSYLPMLKLNGLPVTTYRPYPGQIFKQATRALGIKMKSQKFRSPQKAMEELDANLEKGIPTGMVVGVFHLSYFPTAYRFHFNAHNIIAIGKENGKYTISDPVMDNIEYLPANELRRVRYAKGIGMPNGKMYYIKSIKENIDLDRAIRNGLKRSVFIMNHLPGPIIGVSGIKYLSKRIRKWPNKLGKRKASNYLAQIIRMQEEIGTGGAGFRFIFAAFLQEAAAIINKPEFLEFSKEMTQIGDKWRRFASIAARLCKNRETNETYDSLADLLYEIALNEQDLYRKIGIALKKK